MTNKTTSNQPNKTFIAYEVTEEQAQKIRQWVQLIERVEYVKIEDKTAEYMFLRAKGLINGSVE